MKKLVLYDHQGHEQLALDVYMEGNDFEYNAPIPKAYWLGKIAIMGLDTYAEIQNTPVQTPYKTMTDILNEGDETFNAPVIVNEYTPDPPMDEYSFGDMVAIQLLTEKPEVMEEVINYAKPKTASNKSSRNRRTRKANKHESAANEAKNRAASQPDT